MRRYKMIFVYQINKKFIYSLTYCRKYLMIMIRHFFTRRGASRGKAPNILRVISDYQDIRLRIHGRRTNTIGDA